MHPINRSFCVLIAGIAFVTPSVEAAERAASGKPEFLNSPEADKRDLPFSEAVRAGDLLFVAGQVGADPATGRVVPGGIEPEARQSLKLGRIVALIVERQKFDRKDSSVGLFRSCEGAKLIQTARPWIDIGRRCDRHEDGSGSGAANELAVERPPALDAAVPVEVDREVVPGPEPHPQVGRQVAHKAIDPGRPRSDGLIVDVSGTHEDVLGETRNVAHLRPLSADGSMAELSALAAAAR